MTIPDVIQQRGIAELLHFTTNRGALGVLACNAIKPLARLKKDPQLEKIFFPNAKDRSRDAAWHDYVNLSITSINSRFFSISANNWHREQNFWWAIFSINPEVMDHNGVYFATTNNMYSGVSRGVGERGLQSLFASNIEQWRGKTVFRQEGVPENQPTCNQAEVLYPGELSTDYIQEVYVYNEDCGDELAGQMAAVGHSHIPISVKKSLFGVIE
ncbi:DarT ssDNA thymidine ADP-ribosyltransferase family protein [Comamonas thiooxydans]|uniref:DarT ssDNA thymidine ADP-ribosyltransferase family protein n=1 Tax=Comamonas thiooxydans TaxID=363952 RepID=UPI0006A882DB|nr:DarT ssDNA thymidine ADP-ribosyltransferase family protein [Comamonas thiooxydans]CUA99476.1 Domain of unknown function (DUF4433) [Comamonas thiooxydans]